MPLLDFLFPPRCLGCDTYLRRSTLEDALLCPLCHEGIFWLTGPCCPRCGARREGFAGTGAGGVDDSCRDCIADPPVFASARSPWEYDGVIAEVLPRIKYGHDLPRLGALAALFRPWLIETLHGHFATSTKLAILPIPMHLADLRRRGFNLPALLARRALQGTPYGLDNTILRKVRRSPAQASLTRHERRENLKGAFAARSPGRSDVAVLFDDVMTTGTTAREAAHVLKEAGWREVHVLTLARAL